MAVLKTFIRLNRRATRALTPVHVHEANVFGVYRKLGTLLLTHPSVHRVADVGAGRSWHFPHCYKDWYGIHLTGLDIDEAEMVENAALDAKIVCDVCQAIPLDRESVDLVMVNSGIEHFSDNAAFLRNAFEILRPGGFLLAQFPGRYAPFAMLNRILPKNVSGKLLKAAMGQASDHLGFPAHYDRTHFTAFRRISETAGFQPLYHSPGYYSSSYFEFLLPLWLVSYGYDVMRFAIGWRDLASYNLFLLQKPGGDNESFQLHAWEDISSVRPAVKATPSRPAVVTALKYPHI